MIKVGCSAATKIPFMLVALKPFRLKGFKTVNLADSISRIAIFILAGDRLIGSSRLATLMMSISSSFQSMASILLVACELSSLFRTLAGGFETLSPLEMISHSSPLNRLVLPLRFHTVPHIAASNGQPPHSRCLSPTPPCTLVWCQTSG